MSKILPRLGKRKKLFRRVLYALCINGFALLWYVPIFWMVSTSLKPSPLATKYPPRWIPDPVTGENYVSIATGAIRGVDVIGAFWRSLIVATVHALGVLLVATPAAYALSRFHFPGRTILFWTIVATLAFPPALFLVPNFLIIKWLGIMDTLTAVILPGIGGAFGVFLLRQFMLGIPRELEDAAWVDGCSRLRFLVFIVVPLVKPALVALGLISFLASWNNLIWPLLVLNDPAKMTLPVALARLMGYYDTFIREIGWIMSGAMLAVGTAIVIFVIFRKNIIQGVSLSGMGK
jgi:multiple sugar transport system permease protein